MEYTLLRSRGWLVLPALLPPGTGVRQRLVSVPGAAADGPVVMGVHRPAGAQSAGRGRSLCRHGRGDADAAGAGSPRD